MKLAGLFCDGAVFQREIPIAVWGWCSSRQRVAACLHGETLHTLSAFDGRFEFRFPAMEAGGPFELKVWSLDCPEESVVVRDILIGEVWLASGQSNMEFPLKTFNANDPLAQSAEYLAEGGDDPLLRMATIPRNSSGCLESVVETEWKKSCAENAPDFSAVGAWFALDLRRRLNVPVGIIHCSWGGSYAQAWMSREALMRLEHTRCTVTQRDCFYQQAAGELEADMVNQKTERQAPSPEMIDFAAMCEKDRGNEGEKQGWAQPDCDDSSWKCMHVPGSWIGQGINGKGATWGRVKVTIPEKWVGKNLKLHLGGIDKHDITYFNGVEVGRTGKDFDVQYWSVARVYSIPGELVKGGENCIAVRGFTFAYDGAFGGGSAQYYLEAEEGGQASERIALGGMWRARAEFTIQVSEEEKAAEQAGVNTNSPNPEYARPFATNQPHCLFDGMIAPLIPYSMRGVIWYQGENDCRVPYGYAARMKALAEDWRYRWGLGDFPFYCVQISSYEASYAGDAWTLIQNQQAHFPMDCKNAGVVASTDIGEINDIHPHDKRTVGKRLAALALHSTYGCREIMPLGPTPVRCMPCGRGRMRIVCDWARGIHASGNDARHPLSFEVAGLDGVFAAAEAEIQEDDSIVLTCNAVDAPCFVRYNWKNITEDYVYNEAGCPMLSFNTAPVARG